MVDATDKNNSAAPAEGAADDTKHDVQYDDDTAKGAVSTKALEHSTQARF